MLKILWITGTRIVGGAERATLKIAEALRDRGHSFEVVCRPDSDLVGALRASNLIAHSARLGGNVNLLEPLLVSRLLRTFSPDIALSSSADDWLWCCLAPRPARTHLVLVRHMSLPLPWGLRRMADWRADAIVAVSDAARAALLVDNAIRPSLTRVIHNPVRFAPRSAPPNAAQKALARDALQLPRTGKLVCFLGGLAREKGVIDAAEAVGHANRMVGDVGLVVCGPKAGELELAALNAIMGGERLHYLGQIEAVRDVLTASDVLVVATRSRLSEGLSLSVLEAMACGTPCVAYATGGVAEALGDDGTTGRLVTPDNVVGLRGAVAELLSDSALAERMATKALDRIRQFFLPGIAAALYERLFLSLIEHRR